MNTKSQAIKVLLVSVGGTPAPIIHSILQQQPEYVIFFCSKSTRAVVQQSIRPALDIPLKDTEIITTNEEDLVQCCRVLFQKLPEVLEMWGLDYHDLAGDFTGGTKVMSAAVAMVLAGMGCRFSYVGGGSRNKNGLGQVEDGAESLRIIQDPMDVLMVDRLRTMESLFNSRQYLAMGSLAAEVSRSTSARAPFFRAMEDVAAGYYSWDNFDYRTAMHKLAAARSILRAQEALDGTGVIAHFLLQMENNINFLNSLSPELELLQKRTSSKIQSGASSISPALVQDLVSNAIRCAEQGERYDDAVIRLYSAVEKLAKLRLLMTYGLNNSALNPDSLTHQGARDFLASRCSDETPPLKLPLQRSYELLEVLGDSLGATFMKHADELQKLQDLRNHSILAHGINSLGKEKYESMLNITLNFLEMDAQHLPRFPQMAWKGLGY
ncbi:MAG: TIGR02710 family CRISPR-associated protein [Desulfovibrio sp.]|nr:TIGR02710 family CRISPR-associated protein [Desulfovibrio sp.]